jgi:hypothetical protein
MERRARFAARSRAICVLRVIAHASRVERGEGVELGLEQSDARE